MQWTRLKLTLTATEERLHRDLVMTGETFMSNIRAKIAVGKSWSQVVHHWWWFSLLVYLLWGFFKHCITFMLKVKNDFKKWININYPLTCFFTLWWNWIHHKLASSIRNCTFCSPELHFHIPPHDGFYTTRINHPPVLWWHKCFA